MHRIRHSLAVVLLALWWGGFSFYAGFVVFDGHAVLKSKVKQGFITERVTTQLNWLAVAMLAVTAWELAARRRRGESTRAAWLAWAGVLVTTTALFALHAQLAGMLDFASRTVSDDDHFYARHRVYLLMATAQWVAGLGLLHQLTRDRSRSPAGLPI